MKLIRSVVDFDALYEELVSVFCFTSLNNSKVVVKLDTGNKLELMYFT